MSKYTREVLGKAVAESNSVADVLRRLGLRLDGGTHAHISRRIKKLNIDTAHFGSRIQQQARTNRRRRSAEDLLTMIPAGSRRTPGQLLMRSLLELGREERCASCGIGPYWNNLPITLHIDHFNGNFLDNRVENLRILCPNCHSQTPTFGNRRTYAAATPSWTKPRSDPGILVPAEDEVIALIRQVDQGELSAAAATRFIGCSYTTFYRIRARLEATGSVAPLQRARTKRSSTRVEAVVGYALRNPGQGPKKISDALRIALGLRIAHGTITTILKEAGLGTRAERYAAAVERGQLPAADHSV